jgi:2-C-methyl-D-erythritol 4-phosphate cytidylyltransferase
MKRYAIIVAGGKGLRMGGELPKQFIPIEGRPVLMRTLDAFHACDASIQLILVLPRDHQPYWRELCAQYQFAVPHRIADGGATRFHSVQSGLSLVDAPEALVAVHDGVRPFVSPEVISRCYAEAEAHGAVVPVIPVVETVRQLVGEGSKTVARDAYRLVQTPQTFRATLLRRAYEQPYCDAFTDDASVVEALGSAVSLVDGNRENIKLTTPFDLIVAKALVDSGW